MQLGISHCRAGFGFIESEGAEGLGGVVYWGLGFKVWVHSSVSALIKAPLTVRLDHLFGLGVWGFWGLGGSPTPNFTELKFCCKV